MGCCDGMLKYIVFLLNFAFFATGCILIGAGAFVQIKMKDYFDFLGHPFLNASVVLIIIGCVILVVSFFGCCGACTENACMLYTYAILMTLILLAEIGVAVTIYVYRGGARDFVSTKMRDGMKNYDGNESASHAGVVKTWNTVQADFHCCGVESFKDWKNTTFGQAGDVPDSCCVTIIADCGKGKASSSNPEGIYQEGCFVKFENLMNNNVAAVAGVGAGIAVFQLLGVIVSCFLAAQMRRKDNYV